LAKQIAVS